MLSWPTLIGPASTPGTPSAISLATRRGRMRFSSASRGKASRQSWATTTTGRGSTATRVAARMSTQPRKPSATDRSNGPRHTRPTPTKRGSGRSRAISASRPDRSRFLLVHGSPRRINEYLYEDKPDATFARIAEAADADVIVCGHTHRPYRKPVGATLFVNDGSAGKPKDGDPRACWTLIEVGQADVLVEFRRVEYDVEAAARAIEASDLPHEFANQLREARGYRAPAPA